MPAKVATLKRVFKFKGTEIEDPIPGATPERCLEILRTQYPQFANSAVDGPSFEGGKEIYNIKVAAGTLG